MRVKMRKVRHQWTANPILAIYRLTSWRFISRHYAEVSTAVTEETVNDCLDVEVLKMELQKKSELCLRNLAISKFSRFHPHRRTRMAGK